VTISDYVHLVKAHLSAGETMSLVSNIAPPLFLLNIRWGLPPLSGESSSLRQLHALPQVTFLTNTPQIPLYTSLAF